MLNAAGMGKLYQTRWEYYEYLHFLADSTIHLSMSQSRLQEEEEDECLRFYTLPTHDNNQV